MIRVTKRFDRRGRQRAVWCDECGTEMDFNDSATVEGKVYCYTCAYLVDTGVARICPACRNYYVKGTHLCGECIKDVGFRRIARQWSAEVGRTEDQNNRDRITLLE